jgi:mono/diheme cytochrome c family protein
MFLAGVKPWGVLAFIFGFALLFTGATLAAEGQEGTKLYQQWCSTCHGDRGQGLTAAWRATWPANEQNCWQSKCHASNHPPDGFTFPQSVPPLIGDETLTKFNTAQDLYAYIRATMPYWSPQLLADEDYLAITTFLVEANYVQKGLALPADWPQNLAATPLQPNPAPTPSFLPFWPVMAGLGIVVVLVAGGWLAKRNRRQPDPHRPGL